MRAGSRSEAAKRSSNVSSRRQLRGGSSTVWSIAEDAAGHLWLGLETGGVCRFHPDKNTFAYYRHSAADPHSLSADDVRKVYVDRRNRVWFGTYGGGLNRYDPSRDQIIRYARDPAEKGGVIWDILEDGKGQLWIGEAQGVSLLDEATGRVNRFGYREGQNDGLGNHVVRNLFEDRAGDVWLGFFPSGVDMVDARASVFRNYRYDPLSTNSLTDGGVIASFEDTRGNLWLGTGLGLTYFDRRNHRFTRIHHVPRDTSTPSGSTALSIVEDYEGVLWLGIWSSGLNRRDLAGVLVDGGSFDWRAQRDGEDLFPSFTNPDPAYHGAVYADLGAPARGRDTGAALSPFNAWTIAQGIDTLSLRVERHVSNAQRIAEWLEAREDVATVSYAGLPSSPWHETQKRISPKGAGAIVTFELASPEGTSDEDLKNRAWAFIDALKLHSNVANVGDVRSLVIHPAPIWCSSRAISSIPCVLRTRPSRRHSAASPVSPSGWMAARAGPPGRSRSTTCSHSMSKAPNASRWGCLATVGS